MNVDLTLASHTNVGKTTLMRTLLRRDIGEVADRAHVTETAERHVLVETAAGDALNLWDTPGFGDSARLLKRLRASGNPIGWLQTQVWDRFVDRPFFSSQQAVRAVRDSADLVLYLVNAGEDEASAAYVEAELQILQWVGKPVLLLLNQTGRPRTREAAQAEEERWQHRLSAYVPAGAALTLDAFARCWVQEDRLLRLASAMLAAEKREAFERLRAAWRDRNLAVFAESMSALAATLAQTALDREALPESRVASTFAAAARRLVDRERADDIDPAARTAVESLSRRLRERERLAADRLIALHGLAGNARERILSDLAAAVELKMPLDVAASGAIGGLVGGALTGLAVDAAAGGMTFGLGALLGGIIGALGTSSAVHAYNDAMQEGGARWLDARLTERAAAMLLLYLAVAHFGRGRGTWVDEEAPAHWAQAIGEALATRTPALEAAWAMARAGADAASVAARIEPELAGAARELLARLYPEASELLARSAG